MTMWVYMKTEPQLYTVGFYDPNGVWHGDSDHDTREGAQAQTAMLNGQSDVGVRAIQQNIRLGIVLAQIAAMTGLNCDEAPAMARRALTEAGLT